MRTRGSDKRVSFSSPKAIQKKRKQSGRTLFFFNSRSRDPDDDESRSNKTKRDNQNPQLELLFKAAPYYEECVPLPYELLMKIFTALVESSDNPIRDLCSLARVCENWRHIVLQANTHQSLWCRVDLRQIPMTTRNVECLQRVFANKESLKYIKELAFRGTIQSRANSTAEFIEELITAPNLKSFSVSEYFNDNRNALGGIIIRSLHKNPSIHNISITNSKILFRNQKWFCDYLIECGNQLRELDLAMSMNSISTHLMRLLSSEVCPNLRVLDLSTYDAVCTHSFDAILLAQNLPHLEVLRLGNVSFKRVTEVPRGNFLTKLRELSMPIGFPDSTRDDALFATLTYGSNEITTLDLRGSNISAKALLDLPSRGIKELHIDDLCPQLRKMYHEFLKEWSSTLEVLSLVKINCPETISRCLKALYENEKGSLIRDIDLSSSDVGADDLKKFLRSAKHLTSINLSSCRTLPRGCKGIYSKKPVDGTTLKLRELTKRLG